MTPTNEELNLKKLAVALAENPRGTLKDLAESSGISKATLHRIYGTRENLEKILEERVVQAMADIIATAHLPKAASDVLDEILHLHLEHKEILRLVSLFAVYQNADTWLPYMGALDGFFLRGQESGFFRVDLSAQALTELFVASLCGMIDAERRGRVASTVIFETTKTFFVNGAHRGARKEIS